MKCVFLEGFSFDMNLVEVIFNMMHYVKLNTVNGYINYKQCVNHIIYNLVQVKIRISVLNPNLSDRS